MTYSLIVHLDLIHPILSSVVHLIARIAGHVELVNRSVNEWRWGQGSDFVYITVYTHDVRRHHELHIETGLSELPVALLAAHVVALWALVRLPGLLMLRNKHLLREHLSLVLLYT